MTPQTFRAPNMMTALETIQRELGPEAVVLSVREVMDAPAWQVWKHPGVEVVAMGGGDEVPTQTMRHTSSLPAHNMRAAHNGSQAHNGSYTRNGHPKVVAFQPERIASPAYTPPSAPPAPDETRAPKRQPSPEIEALLARLAEKLEPTSLPTKFPTSGSSSYEFTQTSTSFPNPKESASPTLPAALTDAQDILLYNGLSPDLVEGLINTCAQTLNPTAQENPARVKEALRTQLTAGIRLLDTSRFLRDRIICLIGTSGVGKTSTAAKLAARAKKLWNRKVTWICADTIRAGAIAQASALTESLSIPLRIAYTPKELKDIVANEADSDLLLVDTPATNPRRDTEMIELANFLTVVPNAAIYPVLSATAKDADLGRATGAFTTFHPRGLILTHLDETDHLGNVINLAWHTRQPLAFFTAGPGALDEIQGARAERLLESVF